MTKDKYNAGVRAILRRRFGLWSIVAIAEVNCPRGQVSVRNVEHL
jgi:hypothetical protein